MATEDETAVAEENAAPPATKRTAAFHYVVREPFGQYRKGHRLTDAEKIDAAHDAGHANKLIRVAAGNDFVEA